MKLIRGAMVGAAVLALATAPTVVAADASKLSLSRASTAQGGSRAKPKIPHWLAGTLVAGVVIGAAFIATQSPDSP